MEEISHLHMGRLLIYDSVLETVFEAFYIANFSFL